MASISAGTTHKVGVKKIKAKRSALKSGGAAKMTAGGVPNGRGLPRRGSAPRLLPAALGHPTEVAAFLALTPDQQRERTAHELVPHCLGERAVFHENIGAMRPHTASTTQTRGRAAADLAVLVKHLGPIVVLKKFGVLREIEAALLPQGMGAVFGSGGMRKICSTASLASLDSGHRSGGGGTSSVGTDSKRGKTTPATAREGALLFLRALCESGRPAAEPYAVPLLAAALDECGSSSSAVREAAGDASAAIISTANALAVPLLIVPVLFEALRSPEWRVKTTALERLALVATTAPRQTSRLLPSIIPMVTSTIWDTKPQVSKAATAALLAVCNTNENPDVRPAIPKVVHAVSKPADTFKAVEELMATTFVATVDASTLSILCPILSRGLKEKNALRKRACCVVIENMSRLVDSPNAVKPFGPLLVPELKKVVENVQFEDIRDVALSALQALTKALGHADIESAMASILQAEAARAEEEQRRIEAALEAERAIEEEHRLREEEERAQFRVAMEAQRQLDKLSLEEEEARKKKKKMKDEVQKTKTKSKTGKCQGCGLKKCKKGCLFYSEE